MSTDLILRAVSAAEPARPMSRVAGDETAMPDRPAIVAPATPNPRLRLDGKLGMVVLEFRGRGGDVPDTIPTPRAIAAYRAAALSDAPVPIGIRPLATRAPESGAAEPAEPAPATPAPVMPAPEQAAPAQVAAADTAPA